MRFFRPAGNPPPTFARLPTMRPIDAPTGNVIHQGIFFGPTADRFWLRPTPTFERVGPIFPAGTRVTIMTQADPGRRRGRFRLYQVGVQAYMPERPDFLDYMVGWAAFDDADIASIIGYANDVNLLRSYGKSFDGKLEPQ